ncbi:hypothetical protein ACU6U9_16045 [Pseudomonas sp. HK3]|jgi:antibiotic biosynthesis monooxygenase (ABM) superfamily enzyme
MIAQPENPVTVIAKHDVTFGKESEFKTWMSEIGQCCKLFPGYLGTELIRPTDTNSNTHVCIFRFDNFENLENWMNSDKRKELLTQTSHFSESESAYEHYHSLEFWFDKNVKTPARSKMALITFLAIWSLVHFLGPIIAHTLPAPFWIQEMITIGLIVILMTFVIMPIVIKVFSRWLFS